MPSPAGRGSVAIVPPQVARLVTERPSRSPSGVPSVCRAAPARRAAPPKGSIETLW
jgi:hypothetical protein